MSDQNHLPQDLALVLHRVNAWWSEPSSRPRTVATLRWGDRDLSAFGSRLSIEGDDLHVTLTIRNARGVEASRRGAFDDLANKPLEGETEDGWQFSARAALASRWSSNWGPENVTTVTVSGVDWKLLAARAAPVAWIAMVDWDPPDYLGNLQLDITAGGFSRGHYYFRAPEGDYALLKGNRERWVLVVRERDQPLRHGALRRDLNALACAFGAPLAVTPFYAVDSDLRTIGILGGAMARRNRRGAPGQSPVPSLNDFSALPVVLFEKLATHLAEVGSENGAMLTLATWYFIESLEEYSADATIVKMMLATTSAARYLLHDDSLLVDDPDAFSTWVSLHDAELAKLERPGATGMLRRRIADAMNGDVAVVIQLAAAKAKVALLPELAEALAVGVKALQGRTVEDESLYDYLPRLRAIASALIAAAVSYEGRLAGWTKDEQFTFYEAPPDGWWICDEELAATYFIATISEAVPEMPNLWPDVPVPSVPTSGLIALLNRHAASLSTKTDGRVFAEIQPLPTDRHDEGRRYEFVLRASRRPVAKVVLFLLVEDADSTLIEGWDESVTLRSAADVLRFVTKVSESPQTRSAIERLLIASVEAERNA